MADIDFDEFDTGYATPVAGRSGRWINLFGAVCSIALVIGMMVWGYRLAVRDVAGVPVVRAVEGPLRVSPESPGGVVAMHQGLSVNAVASSGTVEPLPETLVLAPEVSDLAAEDEPGLAVLPALDSPLAMTDQMPVSTLSDAPVSSRPVEVASLTFDDPADDATELPATQQEAVAAALAAALADVGADEALTAPETAAAATSPRPRARPTSVAAPQEVAVESGVPLNIAEIDPSTIVAGTRLVQLGAFDDDAGARGEWRRLVAKFPELLGTKSMVIQTAVSGGRTFYRLRAYGFENDDDSRRFCAAFLAENASCIPVTQR